MLHSIAVGLKYSGWLKLDGAGIDLVVLAMGSDELDVYRAQSVRNGNDQSMLIPLDIENYPIIRYKTCTYVLPLDVLWRSPLRFGHLVVPSSERLFRVGMFLPIGNKVLFRNHS